jgi:hypothetical protein
MKYFHIYYALTREVSRVISKENLLSPIILLIVENIRSISASDTTVFVSRKARFDNIFDWSELLY